MRERERERESQRKKKGKKAQCKSNKLYPRYFKNKKKNG